MHIGVINVVRTINKIEMPSTPSLYFIKLFIQDLSSINWKSDEDKSKEYHKNNAQIKVATLLNNEV